MTKGPVGNYESAIDRASSQLDYILSAYGIGESHIPVNFVFFSSAHPQYEQSKRMELVFK